MCPQFFLPPLLCVYCSFSPLLLFIINLWHIENGDTALNTCIFPVKMLQKQIFYCIQCFYLINLKHPYFNFWFVLIFVGLKPMGLIRVYKVSVCVSFVGSHLLSSLPFSGGLWRNEKTFRQSSVTSISDFLEGECKSSASMSAGMCSHPRPTQVASSARLGKAVCSQNSVSERGCLCDSMLFCYWKHKIQFMIWPLQW